jgi:hypothetical protein
MSAAAPPGARRRWRRGCVDSDVDALVVNGTLSAFAAARVPHALGAVDGPAEALAIFGPHGERIHTR